MNDKILTQGEKAFRNSEIHKSRTHLTRLAAVLLVMISFCEVAKARDYVLTYTNGGITYYVGMNGNNIAVKTEFDPSCIWTCYNGVNEANLGTTSYSLRNKNNNTYYLTTSCTRSGFLTYTYTWTALTVQNGANNVWRSSNETNGNVYAYYATNNWNRSASIRVVNNAWAMRDNNTNGSQNYQVTTSTIETTFTNPTISGADVLTATGNSTYTASGAAYQQGGYTNYNFNSANHFFNGNTAFTPSAASIGSYTWDLTTNDYATVNSSGVVNVSSLPETDITLTLTATAPVTGGNPAAPLGTTLTGTKEITIQGTIPSAPIISVSGTTVTLSTTASGTTTIRYTLDGNDPTASTGTVYSGAISLSSSTTSPVTIKAVTVRNGNASAISEKSVTLTLPAPTITANASAGTATITSDIAGATIYYTTDGSEPSVTNGTAYTSGLSGLSAMTTIKAIAVKTGWNDSPVASELVTISSGVDTSTKEVTLFDYEDHNYRYYQPSSNLPTGYPDQLHSPNPRNVKITYKGNGQLTDGTAVSGVKVGVDADANIFVYYKTLEKGTDGKYAYTTIPNPFSVRPKVGNTYYGFSHWKVISIDGGTIEGNPTTINAETEIKFNVSRAYTTNCQSMEVVLEAVWDVAEVSTNGTFSNNYGVERMFYVVSGGDTNLSTANKACTYSSFYPNGTTNGTAAASLNNRVTRYAGFSATYDSKIEYIILRNNNSTLNANGKNFTVGRGVSGYNNGVCATNLYGLAAASTSSFKFRVESGTYTNLYFLGQGRDFTNNALLTTTLGCDYDRAMVEGGDATFNQKMRVTADIALGMNATSGNTNNKGAEIFNCTVKSGNYDLGESNYGGGYQFYISAFGSNGTPYTYGKRTLVVEGGIFSDISGGMETEGVVSNSLRMVDIRIKGGTMNSAVYGAAQYSGAIGERRIVITGGTFLGWIAGGANGTKTDGGLLDGAAYVYVGGNAKVNSGNNTVINRAVGGNVFGAGCGYGSGSSSGQVSLGTTVVVADKAYVERGVYGGGSYGYTTQTSNVYILGGHVGGKNGGVSGTSYSADITGGVYGGACQNQGGTVNITMTDGLVEGGVYGGSNATGTLSGSVTMYIHGGQVGTPSKTANIHGGGYGQPTRVSQNVELTLGVRNQATPGVTVYGDVYGGSALGYVNGTTANNTYHTYVTLNKGIINGSLYGGGLGDATNEANVYGPVQVKVYGGSVRKTDANGANGSGGVYGANNVNGAPQRRVEVDIYGTDPAPSEDEYALFSVYGGGNQADYTFGGGYPTVEVHGCENSIEYVYGGGNAAAVASTDVTIWGGNKIGNVFGGGNGTVTAANVTGNGGVGTRVKIYGGTIGSVFGGSNSQGTIGGTISVNVVKQDENEIDDLEPCEVHIDEVYGGGNMAASQAGSITIDCTGGEGEGIGDLYGGARAANITGDITLDITGGSINRVFGGNNISGNITGGIQVDVNWKTGNDKCGYNYLGSVFGAGNLAQYTIPGGKALAVNILNGTVSGNVFGGGKGNLVDGADRGKAGKVTGSPTVTIGDNVDGHTAIISGDVYGGGDAADVAGTPVIVVNDCDTEIGYLYGGGNAADVNGTNITFNAGTVHHDAFGGGHGDKDASSPSKYADVKGNVVFNVYGGTFERVFAGSNSKGDITGSSTLTINKTGTCAMKIGEVYGGGNEADGNAGTITIGCTGTWTTTGDNNHANANTTDNRIGYELEGVGTVYGGANEANVGNSITLSITGGIVGNAFGGNNNSGNIAGNITVNVNWGSASCSNYLGNVYGGGNKAAYGGADDNKGNYPVVNINGTVSENVFGGGLGATAIVYGNPQVTINGANASVLGGASSDGGVYGGGSLAPTNGNPVVTLTNGSTPKVFGGGKAAGITGAPTVNINGGTVTTGVYGGCDSSGNVSGNIVVNINGGTLGTSIAPLTSGIFGGGYGSATTTGGNVTVNVGDPAAASSAATPTIFSDIYGGSALGKVNHEPTDSSDPLDLTRVNINNGTIHGNIYGGGLGAATLNENGYIASVTTEAIVNGNVQVNIGAAEQASNYVTIDGQVFGCNNLAGTPKGNVNVDVYHTAHTTDNTYPSESSTPASAHDVTELTSASAFAIGAVYGGGNLAHYVTTLEGASTHVHIHNCDNTIEYVYGGGNAASSPATHVTIDGGRFNYIFGGGNGAGTGNPGANIAGNTQVTLNGGIIYRVFGASNTLGVVGGTSQVDISETPTCTRMIRELYGGGNKAPGGSVDMEIPCGTSGIDVVYGGSNEADMGSKEAFDNGEPVTISLTIEGIEGGDFNEVFAGNNANGTIWGNVELHLKGGTIYNAFGGNNAGGDIKGSIDVYVEEDENLACPLVLTNVYGGGKNAAYTPADPASASPHVHINHLASGNQILGNVYGGGQGETATVKANPVVTIGDLTSGHESYIASIVGNVFGGGDLAPVEGSTTITLQKANSSVGGSLFGGGNNASVSGGTTVNMTSGTVTTGIYGGCNSSGTTGATEVNVLGGTVPDVFGGGLGQSTGVTGNVLVNIGAYNSSTNALSGTATVSGNVYGGSAKGSVNTDTSNTTAVNLWAGTVNGDVFGGGLGDLASLNEGGDDSHTDIAAAVNGNARVNLNGYDSGTAPDLIPISMGTCVVKGSIYGSNNYNGSVAGSAEVHVYKTVGWTDDNETPGDASDDISHVRTATPSTADAATYELLAVYGGGNQAAFTGTTTNVVIETCDPSIQSVYGGGNAADATNTSVLVRGAYEIGEVFGGGNGQVTAANVPGTATTVLNGGRIHDFYGGSNSQGTIGTWSDSDGSAGGTDITIDDLQIETDCSLNFDNIYGAGKNADVDGNIAMTMGCLSDAFSTDNLYGGARAANIKGGITLTVTSGKFDRVFGGNDQSGVIDGNIVVNIEETGCKPLIIGQVFGGGNEADFGHNATINARSFTSIGEIYGSGNLADVNGSATVNILTALSTMNGNDLSVFAGETKTIGGNSVTLPAHAKGAIGAIGYVYGGGLGAGTNVHGDVVVNIGSAENATISPVIINDVYGGSALGMVNATKGSNYSTDNTDVSATRDAETAVNIYNGSIGGSVFGGGLGQTSPSSVAAQNFGNTTVTMSNGTVSTAVYGGANVYGVLKGDSKVTITGGTVGTDPGSGAIQDVVFGGGMGQPTLVEGSVEVNIGTMTTGDTPAPTGTAIIWGNVYGGSAKGNVNACLTGSPAALTASTGKKTDVNLYGGTIHGDLFGGGLGDNTTDAEVAANVYGPVTVTTKGGSATNVFGSNNFYGAPQSTVNVHIDGGTFGASVYGGGNLAAYAGGSIVVSMTDGSVGNDVFGGGLGSTAIVTGNTSVTVSGGEVTNSIYGGGSAANLTGNAEVTVSGGSAKTVYGGGNVADVSGNATVNITGGTLSGTAFDGVTAAVFGGGLGNTTTVGGTVTVNIGTRTGDAAPYTYGGTAAITGDVYGGSAKGKVNTTDGSSRTTGATTNVNLYGGTITGNLYGGGLGDATYAADVYGPVTVTTAGTGSADNVFGCNNLNGAPQSTVAVNIGGSTIAHNVYGGGNLADYTYVDAAHPQNLTVTMTGGTVNKNLFGGGLSADVSGGIDVTISGGTVVGDVYGGGALANTNTANWDASTGSTTYKLQVYGLTVGDYVTGYYTKDPDVYTPATGTAVDGTTYYKKTDNYVPVPSNLITEGQDVSGFYIKKGDGYEAATGTAVEGVTYYQKTSSSYSPVTSISVGADVSKYFTKTPGAYHPASGTAVAGTKYYRDKIRTGTWAAGKNDSSTGTTHKTIVNLIGGTVGNAYGGGLGQAAVASQSIPAIEAMVYGDVTITVGDETHTADATAFTRVKDLVATQNSGNDVYTTGHLYGANNINGTPTGNVQVNVYKTRHKDHSGHVSGADLIDNFEIQGVYGGGNLADYVPVAGKQTNVLIDGCYHVSIEFVYGGGNAASVPSTNVLIQACWEVGSAFGGGNGNDKIQDPDTGNWDYKGADVNGDTHISLHGGTINWAFGGSNRMGDCTGDIYYDITPEGDCPLRITTLYGAGSNADVAGDLNLVIKCPMEAGSFIKNVFAGSFNANIDGSVTMTIIGGTYENVYGGNNQSGRITGPITLNIQESSDCQPVIIDKLYGGGNLAPYPQTNGSGGSITINVKSCTRIGTIFGGGNQADVYGNTEVNVNMVKGYYALNSVPATIPDKYRTLPNISDVTDLTENRISCTINNEIGTIGDIYGGGDKGDIQGNAVVNIGTLQEVTINEYDSDNNLVGSTDDNAVLGAHITGNVYGGGLNGEVTGDTEVNIGAKKNGSGVVEIVSHTVTGFEGISIKGTDRKYGGVFGGGNKGDVLGNSYVNLGVGDVMQSVYGGGCEADVKGNTYVTMSGGYVFNGIFGGGYSGSVGTFERAYDGDDVKVYGHTPHEGCIGKPISCAAGTGTCTVVVDGGQIGPVTVVTEGMTRDADEGGPVSEGWIWGGGCGLIENPEDEPDTHFKTYVNETNVTISGSALIMESVIGGGEFGRVLHNTNVTIAGGQIGASKVANNKPVRYDESDFIDPTTASASDIETAAGNMPECSHFPYGKDSDNDGKKEYLPYDPYYDKYKNTFIENHSDYGPASTDNPSDGKTWIGCVFGGGSGYMPHDNGSGYDWIRSAGWVEGNTNLTITGGHILTNVYGGNEYTDVGTPGVANTGKCTVKMSGGTIGVPRTLQQIADHPVTCYLFGGGKGDERSHFNQFTNVNSVEVEVSGGIIYGSVFGGAEDGHVLGDAKVVIKPGAKIGTWGTSYVDGNVFGGGRGFSGENLVAGNVGGNINVNISGGTMLGSVYGGGRLGSVGLSTSTGEMQNGADHGHVTINISNGAIIGNRYEYDYIAPSVNGSALTTAKANMPNTLHDSRNRLTHTKGGNVYAGGMGRNTDLAGAVIPNWQKLGSVKSTKLNITGGAIYSNVYGGCEFGTVMGVHTVSGRDSGYGTEITISGGTIGTEIKNGSDVMYTFGSVFGAGMGMDGANDANTGGDVDTHTGISISNGTIRKDVFGGGEFGHVGGDVVVEMTGGSVGNNLYGGGAFANTNTNNWDASANSGAGGWAAGMTSGSNTTYVHLTGGKIEHDAYGGGLGQWGNDDRAPKVYGDVLVDLNGKLESGVSTPKDPSTKGCIVDRVFGCNDQNGTPKGHVKVHVHATQNKSNTKATIRDKFAKRGVDLSLIDDVDELKAHLAGFVEVAQKLLSDGITLSITNSDISTYQALIAENASPTAEQLHAAITAITTAINTAADTEEGAAIVSSSVYDVRAVYGGGDLATYEPVDAYSNNETIKNAARTEVIIDGCDYTSIYHVYGGSNAAPAPATYVRVNATYEIHELFGGGNGLDNYEIDGVYYENPGANVGYRNYTFYDEGGSQGDGTSATPYKALDKSDATTKELRRANYRYGSGIATTEVVGGRIHYAYGGSNHRGNISDVALSQYQESGACDLSVDETYGASKEAEIDGVVNLEMECVDNVEKIFGAARDAVLNSGVILNITNGTFNQVFGGNNTTGKINGSITINVEEKGCKPILIGELYGAGYLAGYSIYGYNDDNSPRTKADWDAWKADLATERTTLRTALSVGEKTIEEIEADATLKATIEADATLKEKYARLREVEGYIASKPHQEPTINIISASRIGSIYGGGYDALVVGSPHINVNMQEGMVLPKYVKGHESDFEDASGNPVAHTDPDTDEVLWTGSLGASVTEGGSTSHYGVLALGKIGTIFGGGNQADVYGNTYVEIGTGEQITSWEWNATSGKYEPTYETVYIKDYKNSAGVTTSDVRKAAVITGNVYGGGQMGHVGRFTTADATYVAAHSGVLVGKPISILEGGETNVTISNGSIGPDNMAMFHLDDDGNVKTDDEPDNSGHVFGGGMGTNSTTDADKAFVNNANVTIDGKAFVKGSVFGGGENGHVLHDTHVIIDGDCQIGNGHVILTDESGNIQKDQDGKYILRGLNRPYTSTEWSNRSLSVGDDDFPGLTSDQKTAISAKYASSLPECDSWLYGQIVSAGKIVTNNLYAHHDKYANQTGDLDTYSDNTTSTEGGRYIASDGRSFNGSVFGGGSGYFPYEPGEWLSTAGQVEGDTKVEVKGGHILTSLFGGCEMTTVLGDTYVTMSGGTLGVPRTLAEIAAHPVTCYVFGGGKGESRTMLDDNTDVRNANVTVSGGWVYGSVFGGAEDGHVKGDAKVTIGNSDGTGPTIGTWGTSYVDGNIFGGGRGYDGHNKYAGSVEGNVDIAILGGTMLGSVYGGGRLGSVGFNSSGAEIADVAAVAPVLYTAADEVDNPEHVEGTVKTPGIPAVNHGHITIDISGGTIGNTNEFKYIAPSVTGAALTSAMTDMPLTLLESTGTTNKTNNRLKHTKGGNVFTGCMGRRLDLDGSVLTDWTELGKAKSTKLTISGANTWIMGNVYGGGEFGEVTGTHAVLDENDDPVLDADDNPINAGTEILIKGGTIGTEITSSTPVKKGTIPTPIYKTEGEEPSDVKYTFGSVYGGGYGTEDEFDEDPAKAVLQTISLANLGAFVENNTYINMTSGHVRASVYGGGEVAAVGGSTYVNISGGKIGRDEVYGLSSENPGYVMFGSSTMGNVYGGGKGTATNPLVGVIKGNTTINISAGSDGEPFIYHNVYGGGALGSVGGFHPNNPDEDHDDPQNEGETMDYNNPWYIPTGVPYGWGETDGIATINITGGTIGINGHDNGMVNGSSRGDVAKPGVKNAKVFGELVNKDPYDRFAWVNKSYVNIGTSGSSTGPKIKGSVYGGGENGHNNGDATVNIYSGVIGIPENETWGDVPHDARGNVYGAGCGTDMYDSDDDGIDDTHNPWSGVVCANTYVNISGGHVVHNVYGGGSIGSVGALVNDPDADTHKDANTQFAHSWPSVFVYSTDPVTNKPISGKATVNITGGRIGTTGSDNGDVFGGTKGEAGDPYMAAHLGTLRETEVNIDFTSGTPGDDKIVIAEKYDEEDQGYKYSLKLKDGEEGIAGSVYGGGEDGHVYDNTQVNVKNGYIGHAVYGGGKGKGTYIPVGKTEAAPSITAGKVYGNTEVNMSGGHVMRNIYGGGNLGSVGKGNYASGSDDIYPSGYGEKIEGKLWDKTDNDNAKAFMESGITTVNVTGGIVGFMANDNTEVWQKDATASSTFATMTGAGADADERKRIMKVFAKDDLPTGNVFGGCRGQAAAEIVGVDDLTPAKRPDFFLGYVNESVVTIGRNAKSASGTEGQEGYVPAVTASGPRIYGSVYGGAQDGHVRRGTSVTINRGEIGIPFNEANKALFGTNRDDKHWLHRGNVYGAGSGIGKYEIKDAEDNIIEVNSSNAGSVILVSAKS